MLNTFLFYTLMFAVVGVPFYFQYRFRNIAKDENPTSEINSLSAKLSVFVIFALYTMSFLAVQIKNMAYSKIGFCSCILSFFLLYSYRSKLLHQIRDIPANPREKFQRSFRTFAAMALLYGIYFATVQFLIPHVGTLPAVAVALVFIVYSTPFFVRVWMPTQKMHPSIIKNDILKVFKTANSPIHEIYLIDTDKFKSYNALVCGPKYGFGPFQRSLFITRNLFEVLEPEEIHAVVCHEASHFKLHHVMKRGLMSLAGLMLSICAVILPMAFLSILVRVPLDKSFGFMTLTTIVSLVVQMGFIYRVVRKQEFEADLEALNLGATPEAMISALEKITDKNGMSRKKEDRLSRFMFGHAHPSTEERIAAIQAKQLPADTKIIPPWKFTVTYASFVVVLGSLAIFEMDSKTVQPNREVASTGQILPPPDNTLNASDGETEK